MNGTESDITAWPPARLIPAAGPGDDRERARRATSALLAVAASVPEFGRALTLPIGAPAGAVQAFADVPFSLGDRKIRPSGLIRVRRGEKTWTALVEASAGATPLTPDRLDDLRHVARGRGFDALLTISNEVAVEQVRTRAVVPHHYSWSQVLAEAVLQREQRAATEPARAWVLGELIRFLEHDDSGTLEFTGAGPDWATGGSPSRTADLNRHFDALLRFAGLRLGHRLGLDVVPLDPATAGAGPAEPIDVTGRGRPGPLTGILRIPDAKGAVTVVADRRAAQVFCHVDVESPRVGRPAARVSWLAKQLAPAPEQLRVEAFTAYARSSVSAERLGRLRTDPDRLVVDPAREILGFRLTLDRPLGTGTGRGPGSFADSVVDAVETFYADVVRAVRPWATRSLDPEPGRRHPHIPVQQPREAITWAVALPGPRGPSRREIRRLVTGIEGQDEAGWYADPDHRDQLRWWDGTDWSQYVYEVQPSG